MRKVVGGIDCHRAGLNGVSRFQVTKIMYELMALLRMLCKHRLIRGGSHQHLPDLVSAPGTAWHDTSVVLCWRKQQCNGKPPADLDTTSGGHAGFAAPPDSAAVTFLTRWAPRSC